MPRVKFAGETCSYLLFDLVFIGPPISIRGAVRAGENDGVAVGIAQPDFPVIGPAVAVGRIAVAWHDDLGLQGSVEVVKFKPQDHAVSVRPDGWIADATMVMFHVPSMQLKDQPAIRDQSLILRAAVRTLTAEETLIPATARFDVARAHERLWMHKNLGAIVILCSRPGRRKAAER